MKIYRAISLNWITQHFGQNKLPIYKEMGLLGHNGLDWAAYPAQKLYFDVDAEGTVIDCSADKKAGYGIKIITEEDGQYYKHIYWHLKSFNVYPGDKVSPGDLIGYCDNTGYSTGSHLHRGFKKVFKDPKGQYINQDVNNGYWGAIDYEPYLTNVFVKDYFDNLKGQVSILRKVVLLWKSFINNKK